MRRRIFGIVAATALLPAVMACSSNKGSTQGTDTTRTGTTAAETSDRMPNTDTDENVTGTTGTSGSYGTEAYGTNKPGTNQPGAMQQQDQEERVSDAERQAETDRYSSSEQRATQSPSGTFDDRPAPGDQSTTGQRSSGQRSTDQRSAERSTDRPTADELYGTRPGESPRTGSDTGRVPKVEDQSPGTTMDRSQSESDTMAAKPEFDRALTIDRASTMNIKTEKGETIASIDSKDSTLSGVAVFSPEGQATRLSLAVESGKPGRYTIELRHNATCMIQQPETASADSGSSDTTIGSAGATDKSASGDTLGSAGATDESASDETTIGSAGATDKARSGTDDTHGSHGMHQGQPMTPPRDSTTSAGTTGTDQKYKPNKLGTLTIKSDGKGKLNLRLTKKQLGGNTAANLGEHTLVILDASKKSPSKKSGNQDTSTTMTGTTDSGIVACGVIHPIKETPEAS